MSEKVVFKCPRCGASYPNPPKSWLCKKCHSPLIIDKGDIKYRRLLGEGNTPLIHRKEEGVYFKLEYMNPTGSFKDRGVSYTIQYLLNTECEYIIEDSSGNTGISTAVFATATGKKAIIYAPKTISPGKKSLLKLLGAKIVITNTRNKAYHEAIKEASLAGRCYIGHMVNPLFIRGISSLITEINPKLIEKITDIIIPVSSGSLLLGIFEGLLNLKNKKKINKLPRLWSVQTTRNNYLEEHIYTITTYEKTSEKNYSKLADALVVTNPPRKQEIIDAIRTTSGGNIVTDDTGIKHGIKILYKKGFIIEPSSAVVWPAYEVLRKNSLLGDNVLLILTGSGLKYAEHLINITLPEEII